MTGSPPSSRPMPLRSVSRSRLSSRVFLPVLTLVETASSSSTATASATSSSAMRSTACATPSLLIAQLKRGQTRLVAEDRAALCVVRHKRRQRVRHGQRAGRVEIVRAAVQRHRARQRRRAPPPRRRVVVILPQRHHVRRPHRVAVHAPRALQLLQHGQHSQLRLALHRRDRRVPLVGGDAEQVEIDRIDHRPALSACHDRIVQPQERIGVVTCALGRGAAVGESPDQAAAPRRIVKEIDDMHAMDVVLMIFREPAAPSPPPAAPRGRRGA